MFRKLIVAFATVLCSVTLLAQTGGVKGTVVNRSGRMPVQGAAVTLSLNGETVASGNAGTDGKFLFEGLENGIYQMKVKAEGFNDVKEFDQIEAYIMVEVPR